MGLLPLLPLNHVLLPTMPLPLHVFEPRYRRLLRDHTDAAGNVAGFGVVLLRSGAEVGEVGEAGAAGAEPGAGTTVPDLAGVGTVAEVLEVESKPDGTSDLLAVGSRRFTVDRLVRDGAPYLRAEISFLDEPEGDLTPQLEAAARRLMERYDQALERLAGRRTGSELPDDPAQLSYHLAARLPLAPPDRQLLLEDETVTARLRRLIGLLRREAALLGLTRSIAVSPSVLRLGAVGN